ncbi:MAG: ATP-binding protein [Sandaracinaceae bacterium]
MAATRERPRAVVSWSSGKDSAYALHVVRQAGDVEVVGALTTVTEGVDRVAMHGVREALLDRQLGAIGLEATKVRLPYPCPNGVYEARMAEAVRALRDQGVTRIVFGDLFLEDIRAYREAHLAGTGLLPAFPLWGQDTRELAERMLSEGLRAVLTCVDPRALDGGLAGRPYDRALLDALPPGVDPCGENGEFHTLVTAGPMLSAPLEVEVGEVVERDGLVFADVLPRSAG